MNGETPTHVKDAVSRLHDFCPVSESDANGFEKDLAALLNDHARMERQVIERDLLIQKIKEALTYVLDESKEGDILCEDGFTMSFQKDSMVHNKLKHAISLLNSNNPQKNE